MLLLSRLQRYRPSKPYCCCSPDIHLIKVLDLITSVSMSHRPYTPELHAENRTVSARCQHGVSTVCQHGVSTVYIKMAYYLLLTNQIPPEVAVMQAGIQAGGLARRGTFWLRRARDVIRLCYVHERINMTSSDFATYTKGSI